MAELDVLAERLRKLWRECSNFHNCGRLSFNRYRLRKGTPTSFAIAVIAIF